MGTESIKTNFDKEVKSKIVSHEELSSIEKVPIPEKLEGDYSNSFIHHLRSVEKSNLDTLNQVIQSARIGFNTNLVLNIISFGLGLGVMITGVIILIKSPSDFGRIVGFFSSSIGILLILILLLWKGPLDRILESVSNLARIHVITIGLAHRLNQISQVFITNTSRGEMDLASLKEINGMIDNAVHSSVKEFELLLPKELAEEQITKIIADAGIGSKKDSK